LDARLLNLMLYLGLVRRQTGDWTGLDWTGLDWTRWWVEHLAGLLEDIIDFSTALVELVNCLPVCMPLERHRMVLSSCLV
jgi:hypothetical protein